MATFMRRASPVLSRVTRQPRAQFSTTPHARAPPKLLTGPLPAYGPVGVARVLESETASSRSTPAESTLFAKEFSLADRVALVTGANRGIGLETALAEAEAGARTVYCVDRAKEPGADFTRVRDFVARLAHGGRLEYVSQDVTDQEAMWKVGERIGDREGRMDVCVAVAGVFSMVDVPALDQPKALFEKVMGVNAGGTLFTAQAAGRQMVRFGNGGSIVLVASICGSVAMEPDFHDVAYHSSKSAILQMTRSMACELGEHRIRVNSISPGVIKTSLMDFLEHPDYAERFMSANPLGRIGRTDELRGVLAWRASDASSFCTGSDIVVSGGHTAW